MEFAALLAAFRARTPDPGCRALIVLGTRQPITAALLVGALPLQRVAFLLTDQTRQMPADVAALLGADSGAWLCPAGDHSTTLRVYEGVRAVLNAWADLERPLIAVDVTGGLKPMAVGLEKAAHLLGLATLYIESDYATQPDGRSGPVPGSQRLVVPPNPYLVFGDLEAAEATRLYDAHDYGGAARAFAALADRVPDAPGRRFAASARLAAAYAHWDGFDLHAAEGELRAHLAAASPAGERAHLLGAQLDDLARLRDVTGRAGGRDDAALTTLADPDAILPLLGSLYANARRRAAQGRFDSATLLCYRCLELCSQHRLATWGVLSEQPDLGPARRRVPDLARRYEAVQRQQFPRGRPYPLPDRSFGLFVGYMLLDALGDPLVAGYPIDTISRGSRLRNRSILAHGYTLITANEHSQFAALTDALLDRLFTVLGRDRAAWEARATFLPLE
jgi:CRISPR-associated protein (TIGR02710 family)